MLRWIIAACAAVMIGTPPQDARACSVFNFSEGERVLIGRNADWYPNTSGQVWFEPAANDSYGIVFFTVDDTAFPQGGMNDQGLVLAMATIPAIELVDEPNKSVARLFYLT